MKTVCKKLLCLMLVAMMLVSAVPFAFAAGTNISVYVYSGDVNDEDSMEYVASLTAPLNSTVADIMALRSDAEGVYDMDCNKLSGTVEVDEVLLMVSDASAAPIVPADPIDPVVPEKEKHTVYVSILKSDDTGSAGTGKKVVEEGTYVNFKSLAAEFCTLEKYTFKSVLENGTFLYTDGMEITRDTSLTIYVEKEAASAPQLPGLPSIPGLPTLPSQPDDSDDENKPSATVGTVRLTINYNLEGYPVRTVNAEKYDTYDNYVGVPDRNGYTFRGWFSENYDDFIDIKKNVIKADDVIEAVWSSAEKYNLTLDENRTDIETVNRGIQVTYGEKIYDRVMKYTPSAREGYVFLGWKLNGKMITKDTVYDYPDDATAYAVWAPESDIPGLPSLGGLIDAVKNGKVYLEIYTNGDTGDLVRRVDITGYADDNKITQAEVEKVVKKYVTAKSGYSLSYDGLFDEETWWWYCRDNETDGAEYIRVNREGSEYIYVMVKNVKKAVADSSNPKTGDNIMIAVSTMALSAAALVTVIELKKRKMI